MAAHPLAARLAGSARSGRVLAVALSAALCLAAAAPRPPHIVFIVADDLGWNDVSVHGSPQIPTPSIDALAREGVLLGNYHVQPVCSPSRSSFLSGRHVIHTGVYMPWLSNTNDHLNLSYSLMPTYLSRCCNYTSVQVGKWHVGDNTLAALPVARGFQSSLGFWSGGQDYTSHWDVNSGGYDMMENTTIRVDLNGTWTTEIFARHAVETIERFSPESDERLFLYLAFQNVHWPLMAPQRYIDRFQNTTGNNTQRQLVCAMAAFLDDAVGNVTDALKRAGIYDDTVVIFTSDNGGPTHGDEGTQSNNYPLRGGKNTLFEGGTRVVGLVAGRGVQRTNYTNMEKVHATDWLPTLVSMATGGEDFRKFAPPGEPPFLLGDGVDVWQTIATGAASPRDWLLLETHPQDGTEHVHGDALIVGDWKIYRRGPEFPGVENGWFAPPGQDPAVTPYTMRCGAAQPPEQPHNDSCAAKFCLFNVTADPCEYFDLADSHPEVVSSLVAVLRANFSSTAVAQEVGSGCDTKKVKAGESFSFVPCDWSPPPALPLPPSSSAFPPTPFHGGVLANLSASSGAGSASCTWTLSPSGRYSNAQSGLCLTVLGAGGLPGSAVYLAPCGAANVTAHGQQSWTWVGAEMDGAIMFTGESRGQECVTGVDPASAPPSELVLAPCAFLAWQQVTSDADGNGTLSLQNLPAGAPPLFVCSPS